MEDLEILEDINQDDLIENYHVDTENKNKNKIKQKLLFISIVILGVIGMICFLFAYIMGETGMYHGASLTTAHSHFYRSQFYYKNVSEVDIAIIKPDLLEDKFIDSNLVGVTIKDFDDNVVSHYGDLDNKITITYSKYFGYYESDYYAADVHILYPPIFPDEYKWRSDFITFLYNNVILIWSIGVCVGIAIIILYCSFIKVSNHETWLTKIPLEINFICAMIFGFLCCYSCYAGFSGLLYQNSTPLILNILVYVLAFAGAEIIFLFLSLDIATRLKNQTVIKSSIICNSFKFSINSFKNVFININVLWKFLILYVGYILAYYPIFMIAYYMSPGHSLICFIIFNAILFPFIIRAVLNFIKFLDASKKISDGDYNYEIDMKYMKFCFKEFADNLNNISKGMDVALQEKIKSEMLKTELITNVSHDIKTPLTSIINYSDLICKEDCDNDKIKEYSEVLYRQSNKLKKLIEDLIHASKASSGNILADLESFELNLFIEQVIGEQKDKLESKSLDLICNILDEKINIMADGKLLSRVFDNLFENIYKYALDNSRVYLDIEIIKNKVTISLKNMSKYQLNISEDLLTERFIRGDLSRHSEGSGLGLSIAKGLVDTMNSNFNVVIDGDLFKVIIEFEIQE